MVETPASENQQTFHDSNKSFNSLSKEQSLSTDEKSGPRGIRSQRIARAGVSLPAAAQISSASIVSTMVKQFSHLASSPDWNPVELPELIPNSLGHLSPTAGKISLLHNDGYLVPISTLDSTAVDNSKALEETTSCGFCSQLPLDITPSNYSGLEIEIPSPTETNNENIENEFKEEPSHSEYPDNNIYENSSYLEDDGYNWRKYGQKQVKGIKHPRSYYKCSHPNCEARKIVERSPAGYITLIIYRKKHGHEVPVRQRRSLNPLFIQYYNNTDTSTIHGESSSSNHTDELEGGEEETHADSQEDDDNGPNQRDMSVSRNVGRLPRVVFQTRSDADILDDGYKWRKYGQKMVKGNANARSYYKCTTKGCTVRKQVERAPDDCTAVRTTYEGKHNHEVPHVKIPNYTSYESLALNRRYPSLPQAPLMGLGYPPFSNCFEQPDYNYGLGGHFGFSDGGVSNVGQMDEGQFGAPIIDSDYYFAGDGGDGVMETSDEELVRRHHHLGPPQ